MKFRIRFADQIVGFFVVLALVSLVFVVIMLGRTQRWFAKDVSFFTVLPTAGGLSKNMAIQYRGFTIGSVKEFYLTDNDFVEVVFEIHEEYSDRVRLGSMVEVSSSPIGLGSQFMFHSGRGEVLAEGSFLPAAGSAQARELIRQGLAVETRQDDSITVLISRANSILDELNQILAHTNEALGVGSDSTEIGKIVGSLQKVMEGAETLPGTIDSAMGSALGVVEELQGDITPILATLNEILGNVNAITAELNRPDGLLYTVLDTDEEVYTSLVAALRSVTSILDNLDRTTAFIPTQLPQIAGIIMEIRGALRSAEDVLVALTNNPLLRKGIPQRPESQGGTGPRDIRF